MFPLIMAGNRQHLGGPQILCGKIFPRKKGHHSSGVFNARAPGPAARRNLPPCSAVTIDRNSVGMVDAQRPSFYVVLTDHDRWAVEVAWSDGTLEQVDTFREHSVAARWVATQSDAWLEVRRIFDE